MKRLFAVLVLSSIAAQAQTITETFGIGANQFSMDFVEIGNPGNSADFSGEPYITGRVSYLYKIGRYEISREQIEKANIAGELNIHLADMASFGGNRPAMPATGVSWYDAARFVNYLNTNQGFAPAYKFSGSFQGSNNPNGFGLWAEGDQGFDPNNPFRNSLAKFWLPSTDEWYKAAYGVASGLWYNFPSTDTTPNAISGGTAVNSAVYNQQTSTGPADIFNSGEVSGWGAMAMAGNVWEWTETAFDRSNDASSESREYRGGSWNFSEAYLSSTSRLAKSPEGDSIVVGFRIAMVPEPSSLSLLTFSLSMWISTKRRR